MEKENNLKIFIVSFIFIFLFSIAILGLINYENINKPSIKENEIITVSENILNNEDLNIIKQDNLNLTLKYKNNTFKLDNDNLIPSSILKVAKIGGVSLKTIFEEIYKEEKNIENTFKKMYINWEELLNSFLVKYEIEPINSEISFNPSNDKIFSYTNSTDGFKLDKEDFYNKLVSNLGNKNIEIEITLKDTLPEFTLQKNKEITKEVSHFITDLSTSKKNRHHNVSTALKKINGLVIKPNETVSFNAITSPQDENGGYTYATIISDGEYVDGMGGGICQASTTLYNAVILAGLKVKEVHKHSIPVGYVKMGLDSMVSSYSDFVFENTSKYPLYIKAYTDKESAYVYLYGKTMEDDEYIVRRNEIVKTISPPKALTIVDENGKYSPKIIYTDETFELKYARNGYEVNGYLDYYKGNKKIKTEKIRHEIYAPQQQILMQGAKERPIKSIEENISVKENDTTKIKNSSLNEIMESNSINSSTEIKNEENLVKVLENLEEDNNLSELKTEIDTNNNFLENENILEINKIENLNQEIEEKILKNEQSQNIDTLNNLENENILA